MLKEEQTWLDLLKEQYCDTIIATYVIAVNKNILYYKLKGVGSEDIGITLPYFAELQNKIYVEISEVENLLQILTRKLEKLKSVGDYTKK